MDGTPIAEEDRTAIQFTKIVKDFKKGKTPSSEVPF
jgi:hypothetical protein